MGRTDGQQRRVDGLTGFDPFSSAPPLHRDFPYATSTPTGDLVEFFECACSRNLGPLVLLGDSHTSCLTCRVEWHLSPRATLRNLTPAAELAAMIIDQRASMQASEGVSVEQQMREAGCSVRDGFAQFMIERAA